MCGIAGVARKDQGAVSPAMLRRMADALKHRGPDGAGFDVGTRIGLAHTRLSILDPANGAQPMESGDGRFHLVYNGEVFNFRELRAELEGCGHRFSTGTDTEVVLHGWEEWGPGLLPRLNGQFAFAIADHRTDRLMLARDRFGILPLFYTMQGGDLYFASEVKALFATGVVTPAVDPAGLDEVFTFWAARPPRTPFRGVCTLEPGEWGEWQLGGLRLHKWHTIEVAPDGDGSASGSALDPLLRSAVAGRLLADVPVGAYLSGGLDSSLICALAAEASSDQLRTFSVGFDDPRFDERGFQRAAATAIGTLHTMARIGPSQIAAVFPEVVAHAETPMVRTAPAPLYLLSKVTRERGIKVVLSGEGADEIFWGYDLFKETVARLDGLRRPGATDRGAALDQLHAQDAPERRAAAFWREFFLSAGPADDPLFSHLPRIRATQWIRGFYSADFAAALRDAHSDPLEQLRSQLPPEFGTWSPLARAAYLEMTTFLSPYLLSSQGDRMAMAHGVELRVPYLDHRVAAFAARLPEASKLRGQRDKVLLRQWAATILPKTLARRPKHAYRAPMTAPFFGADAPEYVSALLDPSAIREVGIFDPTAVSGLVQRCRSGSATAMREGQALVAVLSTQLWHHHFFDSARMRPMAGRDVAAVA